VIRSLQARTSQLLANYVWVSMTKVAKTVNYFRFIAETFTVGGRKCDSSCAEL